MSSACWSGVLPLSLMVLGKELMTRDPGVQEHVYASRNVQLQNCA